jgi:phosphoglycerol transferase MdoB-like AlkP superfamily enzyme
MFNCIKNYFTTFFISYIVLIFTKLIFIVYLYDYFKDASIIDLLLTIFLGYKFDFATSGFVALLSSLFNFRKTLFAFSSAIFIVILLLTQLSDILYFYESSRHIGYEITDTITDMGSLFMTAYSQHTIFTILSLLFALFLFLFLLEYIYKLKVQSFNKLYFVNQFILLLITIFFVRGMTQSIPLNPWQSNKIGDTKLASIALNGTYNIIYSLANKKKQLQPLKLPNLDEETIKLSLDEIYQENDTNITFPIIKSKPNIVFLFLESWGATLIKPYGGKYDTTPFFNQLLQKSIRPTMMIAGGHRTTEGMFAVISSWQNPLGKSVAKTQLQNFKYPSIVNEFNRIGYNSAFFQGTSKETSGTGSFAQNLGFKQSYGKKDITKRIYEENYWGVHDVDLYNFVQEKLNSTLKEPFVIGINGATTHDNKIPKGIEKINFTTDKINDELNALHFSDMALKSFVENIENKYPNTIFVVFADHCGGGVSSMLENYEIPFALYSKQLILPKYYDTYLSQRDIAPSIYDLVIGNYKTSNIAFSGKSLFQDNNFFADFYHNGVLGWIENHHLIQLNLTNNNLKCFDINQLDINETKCIDKSIKLKNHALSFTKTSQDLLFSNKIKSFNRNKYIN